jgi:haloacid dehalogenase-like hydrolase
VPESPIPVAIAYDFDGTLAPGNMQEHVFLPKLGIDKDAFWKRSNALAADQRGDRILTYMHRMLGEAKHADQSMRREDWVEHGRGVTLFPGVEDWFPRITAAGRERGLDVQHYIVSSGLREMIEGTPIGGHFAAIFASAFLYDGSGVAVGPALAVNYTTKTQFLFRINKGALDVTDDEAVNAFVEHDRRKVPFANMTFIGDGDTDIPCFRLVKEQGGHSIAVFDPAQPGRAEKAQRLIADRRVHCAVTADYTAGGELDRRMHPILDLIRARAVITAPTPLAAP